MARFLARFSILAGALLAAYYFPYADHGLAATLRYLYLAAYAHLAGGAISIFDRSVHVDGTHIQGRMGLEFAMSCDAMDVLCLFAAATLAFPATWRWRAVGLGAACVSILAVNVLRIVTLYFIGLYAPSTFALFHMQLFPLAIVIFAALGFVTWARWAGPAQGGIENAAVKAAVQA
jgi:exosortase/archaeosortase family protein